MVGYQHQLNKHEFESTPGKSEGREAKSAAVHVVAKGWPPLSNKTTEC